MRAEIRQKGAEDMHMTYTVTRPNPQFTVQRLCSFDTVTERGEGRVFKGLERLSNRSGYDREGSDRI